MATVYHYLLTLQGSDSSDEVDEETQSDIQSTTRASNENESEGELTESQLTEEISTTPVNRREQPEVATPASSVNKHVAIEQTECEESSHQIHQGSHKLHVFSTPKIGSRRKKHVDSDDKNETAEVFQMMKSVFENRQVTTPRRDEYDVFGEMVAHNIRILQTDQARVTVQHKINNLLYEARIGDVQQNLPIFIEPSPSPRSSHTVSSYSQSAMSEIHSEDVLQWAIASSMGVNTNDDDTSNNTNE